MNVEGITSSINYLKISHDTKQQCKNVNYNKSDTNKAHGWKC